MTKFLKHFEFIKLKCSNETPLVKIIIEKKIVLL